MNETHIRFLILQTTFLEYVCHRHELQVWYIFVNSCRYKRLNNVNRRKILHLDIPEVECDAVSAANAMQGVFAFDWEASAVAGYSKYPVSRHI
jgi:hypothetical protein